MYGAVLGRLAAAHFLLSPCLQRLGEVEFGGVPELGHLAKRREDKVKQNMSMR